jgi:hypothetical protein
MYVESNPQRSPDTAGRHFLNVRFFIRYWEQSGHVLLQCKCPLMTQSGHRAVYSHVLHFAKFVFAEG